MPYAHDGRVSTSPIEGGVEITTEQYRAAIDGMIAGQMVTINNGFELIDVFKEKTIKDNPNVSEETIKESPTLLQYAATKRWETEIAGITVHGIPLFTDDRSKILIMGARSRAEKNSKLKEQWTAADGVIYTLSATKLIKISDAIGEHVSRCFSKFAEVRGKINKGSITTYEQIDAEFTSINTVY